MTQNLRWWQRLFRRVAATPGGAWLASHQLHNLDRLIIRLSHGRQSLAALLTGLPIVTVTTTGAKSGKPRSVPLVGIPTDDGGYLLIASNWGGRKHPAWAYNLRAHPQVTVSANSHSQAYIARELHGPERDAAYQRAASLYAGYIAYEQRTQGRQIPVFRLVPSAEE